MGKNKLTKFAETYTFPNFVQPAREEVLSSGFNLKGRWHTFFKNKHPIVLELGCGRGEYTIGMANMFVDKNFIGNFAAFRFKNFCQLAAFQLKNFLQEQRLDKVGVFTYSREEDTAAYDLPDQISEEVMQERYHELMSLQSLISQEINESLEGRELEVLIENRDEEVPEVVAGRSYRDAPEVDGIIYIENDGRSKAGDIVRVKVLAGFVYDIAAERID